MQKKLHFFYFGVPTSCGWGGQPSGDKIPSLSKKITFDGSPETLIKTFSGDRFHTRMI